MGEVIDVPSQGLSVRQTGEVGSPLPAFSAEQMGQAFKAYRDLQHQLDASMPDQIMELDQKKFRKRGYWRAVAVAFSLDVMLVEEHREVQGQFNDGRDNFGYLVTYRASMPNGRSETGDGACFAIEKAPKFRCPHPESEGSSRTLHFPYTRCPSYDTEFRWRGLPEQASEHNIRSHAHTRAFNRAVSNLVGFGDVSAEEMDRDDAPAATTSTGASTTATPKATGSAPSTASTATAAVSADGTTKVKAVKPKPGDKKPGRVEFEDGRSGTTFDATLLENAEKYRVSGAVVKPTFEEKPPAKEGQRPFINVVSIEVVVRVNADVPVEDNEPVGQPEKVLMQRLVKPGYWLIQTATRQYLTTKEGDATYAEQLKVATKRAVFTFTRETTGNGKPYNLLSRIDEEETAPVVAGQPATDQVVDPMDAAVAAASGS